jgi:hypothetical protein
MAGLEALLDHSPKGVGMAQHIAGWADLIRKLRLWGVPLTAMPTRLTTPQLGGARYGAAREPLTGSASSAPSICAYGNQSRYSH